MGMEEGEEKKGLRWGPGLVQVKAQVDHRPIFESLERRMAEHKATDIGSPFHRLHWSLAELKEWR